jgi:hypothetical protein
MKYTVILITISMVMLHRMRLNCKKLSKREDNIFSDEFIYLEV